MIDYSLGTRLSVPADENSEKKVYPYAQVRQVLDIEGLADHIQEHGSPFTADIIVGVARKLVSCIREQLLAGNKVKIGKLGAFYISLSSEGVTEVDKFNAADHITSVNVRWERGKFFTDLKADAEFNYMTTRKQQAESKKQEKQALKAELGTTGADGDAQGGETGNDGGADDLTA